MRKDLRLRPVLVLSAELFAVWVLLSGKFDLFHLGVGALSAVTITLGTQRLLLLQPQIGPAMVHPAMAIPWGRLVVWYLPWLGWQIVLASVQVAFVVLHPKLPISPCLVRFRTVLPHTLARLTLANSITLTPGTVTLDVQGDEFLVHALTAASAADFDPAAGAGSMLRQVEALFSASRSQPATGASR